MQNGKLSRRGFLKSTALIGGGYFISSGFNHVARASGGWSSQDPTRQVDSAVEVVTENHQAVVIGSGFGGAVAALRLGQAGIETIVLERGRRWPIKDNGNTFPTFNSPDRRVAWLTRMTNFPMAPMAFFEPYTGLIERVEGDGMDVMVGAGVGGSSLVYGGMSLQPSREDFLKSMPEGLSYDEFDQIYYPRVKEILSLGKIPEDILNSIRYKSTRLFRDDAIKSGFDVNYIYNATNWDKVRMEIQGKLPPSMSIGELIYGVNSGAKNSVDQNYLKYAEDTSYVKIYPLHIVKDIFEMPGALSTSQAPSDARYRIVSYEIDENGNVLRKRVITCRSLFLAAGSMGTSKLLVRAKATGTLSQLNDSIGSYWGNNGDQLVDRIVPDNTLAWQGSSPSVAAIDRKNPYGTISLLHGPAPITTELHMMAILGMAIQRPKGSFYYDKNQDDVVLNWPFGAGNDANNAIASTLNQMNEKAGGSLLNLSWINKPFTFHPLGGAIMGKACDLFGRVKNYNGLYVTDASLIPGSTGACNPSWTIAANAERCMDHIISEDLIAAA